MKKFEMPVVVLNEMTMNESIAADCCYSVKTEGLVTTKTVLSGGSIGDYVHYDLYDSILGLYGTIGNIPKYHYKYYVPTTDIEYNSTGGITTGTYSSSNVAYFSLGAQNAAEQEIVGTSLITISSGVLTSVDTSALKNGSYIAAVGTCDHLVSSCPFNYDNTASNQHIGSTVKHLFGGALWANPHTAQQYNS